ncbi:redoxin family protein [Hyphomonas sp. FCG-A18]|uniref:redoxin family protein n=1 Tax=Hyphomonas sp. FCG-A18 TaxID=3080019 RepID=UPI002B2D1F8E|nr:redoxin family protein [Hyphomonas sp. FCG-A18]
MKRWMAALPLAALLAIGGITALQLYNPEKKTFEKADEGTVVRLAPDREFPRFMAEGSFSFAPPPGDKPIAVNLFASWCAPCRVEHPMLTELAQDYPDQLYGLAYKDQDAATKAFLDELGDPYTEIGTDRDGQGGLEFGLTGVPETFVIDREGKIILHIRGIIDEDNIGDLKAALDG